MIIVIFRDDANHYLKQSRAVILGCKTEQMDNLQNLYAKLLGIQMRHPEYFRAQELHIFSYVFITWHPFSLTVSDSLPPAIKAEIEGIINHGNPPASL